MISPTVTIVIPVYNGSNYLREAIDSALDQTYDNIEIIVVNDGSTDGGKTDSIARSYGRKIRYMCKNNGGVASALNMAIRSITGEFFAWLSHDDIFSPNRIETDVMLFQGNQQIHVTFCKLVIIDSQGRTIDNCEHSFKVVTNPREALLLGGVDMGSITLRKSCFEKVGLFDEGNLTTQDVIMSLSLVKHYPFHYNNQAIKYSREHPERGTNTMKEQVKKDSLLLCDFLHQECSFQDYFPHMDNMSPTEVEAGWQWLGKLYRYFGAEEYAQECFTKINKNLYENEI